MNRSVYTPASPASGLNASSDRPSIRIVWWTISIATFAIILLLLRFAPTSWVPGSGIPDTGSLLVGSLLMASAARVLILVHDLRPKPKGHPEIRDASGIQ